MAAALSFKAVPGIQSTLEAISRCTQRRACGDGDSVVRVAKGGSVLVMLVLVMLLAFALFAAEVFGRGGRCGAIEIGPGR